MVAAIKPELDDLAKQLGIPPIRGFKSISGAKHVANQGDGVMALNPAYFNAYADRVGGRSPGGALEKLEAERAVLMEQIRPVAERLKAVREAMSAGRFGEMTMAGRMREAEWLALYDEQSALYKDYAKLRDKDDKLWRKIQTLKHTNKGDRAVSMWKPGDDVKQRPFNTDAYFEGMDRARQTMFHEFGHHVHQYLNRKGPRRAFGTPPLELEAKRIFSEVVRDRERWRRQPSTYGTADEYEWFAENFASYVMGRRDLVDPAALDLFERLFRREY